MQKDTKQKKKFAATVAALVIGLVMILCLIPLFFILKDDETGMLVSTILLFYVLPVASVVAGVLVALVQRLRQIERGEEEAAKKY